MEVGRALRIRIRLDELLVVGVVPSFRLLASDIVEICQSYAVLFDAQRGLGQNRDGWWPK